MMSKGVNSERTRSPRREESIFPLSAFASLKINLSYCIVKHNFQS
jgi:hypothetical protein